MGDPALSALARANDTEAFAELWRRHANAGTAAARQFSSIADPQDIVSEAYVRILRALQQGGGPHEAFRPYLYRTIRNIALDWRPRHAFMSLEETPELVDADRDPEVSVLEDHVTAQAFETLPERWRAVLWYLEVEDMSPSDAAPLLGLSPNATSVLAGRAHEGFKKAWLQAHVNDRSVPAECQWTTERMGAYVRHALTKRSRSRFDRHLRDCTRCSALLEEIGDLGGRLAAVLLPAALGASAGTALLGQLGSGSREAPASTRASIGRRALTTGSVVVSLALVASGAYAITTAAVSEPPTSVIDQEHEDLPSTPDPSPAPSNAPQPPISGAPDQPPAPPQPARPPTTGIPSVPPPTIDRTPPTIPVLSDPVDGSLLNSSTPLFAGRGEPGATVVVGRVDPVTGMVQTIMSVIAGPDGHWSGSVQQALPDGTHELVFSQVDRAGNRSEGVQRGITIDTIALAPVVNPLPASPMMFLPVISGRAEPGATVHIHDEAGIIVASATADAAGDWLVPLGDPGRDGMSVSASQRDLAGNTSVLSVAGSPMSFTRPELPSLAPGTLVPSTGGGTVVEVHIDGEQGRYVQVFIDGVGTGNVHELGADPIVRVTPSLSDGPHTVGVRYFDPVLGAMGSVYTVEVVIG